MQIKDIMSKTVIVVAPETPLRDVAAKMQQEDCGCILVAKNDRLVGVITDRDIAMRCVAEGLDIADTTAEQIMSPQILYCRDTDSADEVTKNMGENKVRRLPVLDAGKRLVGIVTLGDMSQHSNFPLIGQTLGIICRNAS